MYTFQDGGAFFLERASRKRRFLWKLDFKNAYLSVPFNKDSQKYVRFQWREKLHQLLSVLWSLFSPRDLYKAYQNPNTISQKAENSDNSLPGQYSLNCTFTKRNDNCQGYIDFPIAKPGISDKCQKAETFNLNRRQSSSLSLPQENALAIIEQCHLFITKDQVSVREISQLFGKKLCYSAIAVLPSPLHHRSFQRQQIFELKKIYLSQEVRVELQW